MFTASSDHSLNAISDRIHELLEGIAPRLVSIHGSKRPLSTGIIWRPGLIVTAEETLEVDEDILLTRHDGHQVSANVVGRDPSTDIALLQSKEQAVDDVYFSETSELRVGNLILAVSRQPEGLTAAFGIVALAGGSWRSLRGGLIDRRLHLDLRLDARAEGGAALGMNSKIIGMTVLDPRGRVLVIPSETIERVAQQLLAHGRIARGYLGLGLQPVFINQTIADAARIASPRGLFVISVDSNGPAQRAGIKQGDILILWNTYPLHSAHDIHTLLGFESIGQSIRLGILRSEKRISLNVEVVERSNTHE